MVYKPSVPQANDIIRISQKDFLGNFSQMQAIYSLDHYAWDSAEQNTRGKHKKITFPNQSSDPTTAANETALYSKSSGGISELFIREESDGTVSRLTKNGDWQYGLQLQALCIIDAPTSTYRTVPLTDQEEEIPDSWINIASVIPTNEGNNGTMDTWTITYTTAFSSAFYFWDIAFFGQNNQVTNNQTILTPKNNPSYANSVTTTQIILQARNTRNGQRDGRKISHITLKVYTAG